MSVTDPLDGADIGTTETVTETGEIWVGGLRHDATSGSDRLVDDRVTEIEVFEDEYGDTCLRVTVESDVTKRLPRRWDTAREPRTDSERQAARRKRWVGRAISGGVMGTTLAVAVVLLALAILGAIRHVPRPHPGVGR